MVIYHAEDFEQVPPPVVDTFYCPGCNRTPDDHVIPSKGCPCALFGSGTGSLRSEGVRAYLLIAKIHERLSARVANRGFTAEYRQAMRHAVEIVELEITIAPPVRSGGLPSTEDGRIEDGESQAQAEGIEAG